MTNKHKGSSFDAFLKEEGLCDRAEAIAIKRIIALEIKNTMKANHITKSTLAKRMKTSRPSLDRLLDPENTSTTLHTLVKVAWVLGKRLQITLS